MITYFFIDESYIDTNHTSTNSYLPTDKNIDPMIDCKSGKGYSLIIIYTITEYGPLIELDLTGIPVDDLKWKGDTCHPKKGQMVN